MRVVVVGAGLGGLSAACHLAGRGHDVVVVERADVPGGRAGLLELGGYRFDTGPSVMTMTGLLSDVFAAAGADMADHLTLSPVDPMYRACFADGSAIHVRHGREAMSEEIRRECGPREAEAFGRFCDWLGELYHLELPNFINRSFDSPLDLAWPVGPIVQLVRLGGFRRLNNVVECYFSDQRLVRLFSFQAMYAGLSPFEALAVYCVITYMDTVAGVYFPAGGMHAIPRALAAAAEKAGASFVYGRSVERVVPARSPASASTPVSWSPPTRWCSTPTCPWRTARSSPRWTPRARPAGATTRPRARCGWRACAVPGRRRRPTTTSTSANRGRARSGHC